VADVITAPSIGTLAVKGNLGAEVVLGAKKVALGSATVGGTVRGAWEIAGSVGTLRLHAVRANLAIGGNVGTVNLDDFVAVSQAGSATGGVIQIGGKGSVAAGKGQEKFDVAKKTMLYTSTADMYTYDELYQYSVLGRSWVYQTDGKKEGDRNADATEMVNGHAAYSQVETGPNPGTTVLYYDASKTAHLLELIDPSDNSPTLSMDLKISPAVFHLGTTYRSTSKASGSLSDSEVSIGLHGTVQYTTRLAGFEVVKVPAGTFLAAKVISNMTATFTGSASGDGITTPVTASMSAGATEWVVPGVGVVKSDSPGTVSVQFPAIHQGGSQSGVTHSVLVKGPVDGV
jgi:hypothetical protein